MALPLQPGVYIMKNKDREIIYIGKAKALKNRVSQYFGSHTNHPPKVIRMVENVDDFDYIITDSEFEALILECSLIKQHSPKYNILLKDDKGYSYIKISGGKWRKISHSLQKDDDNAEYIGPFTNSYYVKSSVDEAVKIFKLPTCNRVFPRDFKKGRPCLNYHINQCCAPCTGKVSFEEYNESVNSALDFLKGGSTQSLKLLNEAMLTASDNLEFERAARIRDRIRAIKRLNEKQKVVSTKLAEQDVIAVASDNKTTCFEVFRFKDSKLYDKESFVIKDDGELNTARTEFLSRYYTIRDNIPKHITLDGEIEDKEIIEKWLADKSGHRVYITVPKKGEQKSLVDMCKTNAYERLAQTKGATSHEYSVLDELKQLLNLPKMPEYIESYDISNLSGSENVAGMIVFKNGKPLKSAYKKFQIKSFVGQDDYASMQEVLTRRFEEYFKAEDKNAESGFAKLPDLILLDGGKGQVSAVREVLKRFSLDIPLFGMVKDDKHRTRAITDEGAEIAINSKRRVFTLVSKIQDEVHRFAIGYHRQRRNKTVLKSSLTDIDGIGTTRAKALLKHFQTISNIQKADLEELENAPTMNKNAALSVYKYFHSEK